MYTECIIYKYGQFTLKLHISTVWYTYVFYNCHSYESGRSTIDRIFGQRFYPGFPSTLRSCDLSCGTYPSTSENRFRNGIDLIQTSDQSVSIHYLTLLDIIISIWYRYLLHLLAMLVYLISAL